MNGILLLITIKQLQTIEDEELPFVEGGLISLGYHRISADVYILLNN